MDRRIIFFLVFIITLTSTLLVTAVCVWSKQQWLSTVLYAVATMWIMGIVSQLLLQNLYHAIVRPLEEVRTQEILRKEETKVDLDDLEEIDQVTQATFDPEDKFSRIQTPEEKATVGVHLEQKG